MNSETIALDFKSHELEFQLGQIRSDPHCQTLICLSLADFR